MSIIYIRTSELTQAPNTALGLISKPNSDTEPQKQSQCLTPQKKARIHRQPAVNHAPHSTLGQPDPCHHPPHRPLCRACAARAPLERGAARASFLRGDAPIEVRAARRDVAAARKRALRRWQRVARTPGSLRSAGADVLASRRRAVGSRSVKSSWLKNYERKNLCCARAARAVMGLCPWPKD